MKSKFVNYTLVGILILVAIFWAYRMFTQKETTPSVTVTLGLSTTKSGSTSQSLTSAEQLIQVLDNVSNVTLAERSLLANKIFQNELKDYGRPLIERPWGRNNPFAAPGTGGSSASSMILVDEEEGVSTTTVSGE